MSKKEHVPIRMCIGCRRKRKKEEMLRFIKGIDGVMFINEKKRINGRGFYLCPDIICFKMAQKKERWVGSLVSMDLLYPLKKGLE
ncbi:MAG: YlxR family protein [Desulfobacterales bacterium]|jgi:predicted RNA-binding protein YlxR (DUF448 family)|nr:YlxR family protein [Desulfobacterales bacterium]